MFAATFYSFMVKLGWVLLLTLGSVRVRLVLWSESRLDLWSGLVRAPIFQSSAFIDHEVVI